MTDCPGLSGTKGFSGRWDFQWEGLRQTEESVTLEHTPSPSQWAIGAKVSFFLVLFSPSGTSSNGGVSIQKLPVSAPRTSGEKFCSEVKAVPSAHIRQSKLVS